MECCTYRQCSSVICYTVDGMLHLQEMFACYMLHSWWNVAHTGNARLLYATQLNGMLHIQEMFVCYMLHSWWNVAHTGNVRMSYVIQLMECCTHRQCSSVICYTVDGMLHIQAMFACYMLHSWWMLHIHNVDGMLHIQAMFVCYMLHSWWNVAHTGNIRLLYDTQLMECCTYRQCSSVICYIDGILHIQAMFVCYMLHSWWNVAHTGNVRLLYATQLMECCTYRQCSSVICYTVDGMLHIQAMFVCYMLHSWWNVAHTGNVRLLYATQLMQCCTCRQCSSVICYTVDGMLHIQAMFVCYMLHSWWNVAHTGNVVCYTLHSWWNVAHTGNVRLLYATQLMECCTYRQCSSVYATQLMECCTYRQCSSVICYTVDGMLHIQAMLVCYMLHSWWNVAHTGICYTVRLCSSVICYTVDGMLHIQEMFACYMLHSWWNVAHAGNVRLLYATQLMECCTYRQCSSVICYTVDGMLHTQAMFVCYTLHSWWNVAHTGNIRLLYATQLMECCTYRQCSSVIWYTVDGMLHIQAMFVCYTLHSWWNVAHKGNIRLLYATQLMECCTYRQCSSVICYTVDGMLHIQAMFVCYMLHSWWNVAHTGNARLLYATQLMGC